MDFSGLIRNIPFGKHNITDHFHLTEMLKVKLFTVDVSGLKTVISELPPASTALAASICKKITGRLTSAIAKVQMFHCCTEKEPLIKCR